MLLLVEDDRDSLDALADLLALEGYTVACASTVDEAWSILERSRPKAVITDVAMPSATGLDLVERMASHPKFGGIAVIIVSGASLPRSVPRNVVATLRKPFEPKAFLRLLATVTHGSGVLSSRDSDRGEPGVRGGEK